MSLSQQILLKIKSLKPLEQVEFKSQQMYTVSRAGKGVGFLQLITLFWLQYVFFTAQRTSELLREKEFVTFYL